MDKSKNARIAINHDIFQCSNIQKGFEHAASGFEFKHRPRHPTNCLNTENHG